MKTDKSLNFWTEAERCGICLIRSLRFQDRSKGTLTVYQFVFYSPFALQCSWFAQNMASCLLSPTPHANTINVHHMHACNSPRRTFNSRCLGVSLFLIVVLIYSAWDTLEPWEYLGSVDGDVTWVIFEDCSVVLLPQGRYCWFDLR